MAKLHRAVQRTRELLQKALLELVNEREYDGITIQDIVDRANVGRTTFYLHYTSKDELLMSCHETIVSKFPFEPLYPPLSRQELLSPETPPGTVLALRHLKHTWGQLQPIFQSKDGPLLLRRLREWSAGKIETNLRAAFSEAESVVSLALLANYLAGAQIALLQWWLEKRQPYTAEDIAKMLHRLQRSAICDAFELKDNE